MNSKSIYVSSLTNISQDESDYLKSKSCIVSISVGEEMHEGQQFQATLRMVNSRFKKCIIMVGDVLQRHTIAITSVNQDMNELYNLSKERGDEWLKRNEQIIKDELRIPYTIIRWERWLHSERFVQNFDKIKNLYDTNTEYKDAVCETISEFSKRYSRRDSSLTHEILVHHSLNYLLEECACILEWLDEKYEYEVYPSKRTSAIALSLRLIEPLKSAEYLRFALVRVDKRAMKEATNFEKITLENILNTLPGHVYWKDKYGTYLGCNMEQVKSYKLKNTEELLGKSDFDLLDYDVALKVRKNDLEVMRSGKTHIIEESAEILGKTSTFLSYKTPFKDHNSAVIGILGVSLNITKQKEAEQKLLEQNHQLLNAINAKKLFLNNISHEIRTPLSCILKISHLLYDDWERYPNNDARKAHLKMAVEGSERLKNVLTNLLDMSKLNAGHIEYDKKLYSLKTSVKDVIDEFIDQKHRIRTYFDNPANLDLIYDHFRIEQVIRNLLANAISYGGDGDIEITLSRKDDFIVFVIYDYGVGVPETELQEIFKMFTQSSITRGRGGTGIGLSISKTIIEDHGGFIWARNNKNGVGSHFSFKLPINTNYTHKEIITNHSTLNVSQNIFHETPNLLLIDDDPSIIKISELVLGKLGFNVLIADSGIKGLNMIQSGSYKIDVVLLDMMLPDLHGIEVLRIIKSGSRFSNIPIYIHSGISNIEEKATALELGAVDFIDKTSNYDEISGILARFLIFK